MSPVLRSSEFRLWFETHCFLVPVMGPKQHTSTFVDYNCAHAICAACMIQAMATCTIKLPHAWGTAEDQPERALYPRKENESPTAHPHGGGGREKARAKHTKLRDCHAAGLPLLAKEKP